MSLEQAREFYGFVMIEEKTTVVYILTSWISFLEDIFVEKLRGVVENKIR